MKAYKSKLLLVLPLFLAAPFLSAQTTQVTLKTGVDGYNGVSNLSLENRGAVTWNRGGSNSLIVGGSGSLNPQQSYKLLLRFDLSAYEGMTVSGDASINLFQVNVSSNPDPFLIDYYQVSAANADWVQGTTARAVAAVGESAWNFKIKGEGDTNVSWAGSNGLSTPGVDYLVGTDNSPLGTYTYNPANNEQYSSIVIPEATLQFWIDNPEANGGIILVRRDSGVTDSYGLGQFIPANRTGSYSNQTPELVFNVQQVPEASTYAMLIGGVAALAAVAVRRRNK